MRPHYDNYIHACVTAGIGYLNLLFSADDLDADGVPNQPEMMYHDGEKWRVVSIDEVKGEDTTHGSGGDRKGRCERTCRAGADDDGECVGNKHSTHNLTLVGCSNAAGEGLPAYAVTASATVDPNWFANGPTTTINGKVLNRGTQAGGG